MFFFRVWPPPVARGSAKNAKPQRVGDSTSTILTSGVPPALTGCVPSRDLLTDDQKLIGLPLLNRFPRHQRCTGFGPNHELGSGPISIFYRGASASQHGPPHLPERPRADRPSCESAEANAFQVVPSIEVLFLDLVRHVESDPIGFAARQAYESPRPRR